MENRIMGFVFVLIRWGLRVWAFLAMSGTNDSELASTIFFLLAFEFIASIISLARFEGDSIIPVVTGFDGSGDTGYYDYTDNSGGRILGWLAWIVAIISRILLFLVLTAW
jgi:hypothetical protein